MKGSGSSCVCCLFFPAILCAQAGTERTAPPELVAHFADGSMIRRVQLLDSIDIQTRYGKLSVPLADIRRIEFATRLSDDMSRQIERAITQLGDRAFARREAAGRELVALGSRAHAALKKASTSADKEVARRAQEIIAGLEQMIPAEHLRVQPQDIIHTHDSVLSGQILTVRLKAKTRAFGETQFTVAELRTIHLETQVRTLALEGTKFTSEDRQWVEAGIHVDAGSDLRIQADGIMDMLSKDQPGQHRCGPEGCPALGRRPDGLLAGTLLGRIGEQGEPFVVGREAGLKGLGKSGKLYLCIIPGAAGQMTGSYQVRVAAGIGLALPEKPQVPVAPSTASAALELPAAQPAAPAAPPAGVILR